MTQEAHGNNILYLMLFFLFLLYCKNVLSILLIILEVVKPFSKTCNIMSGEGALLVLMKVMYSRLCDIFKLLLLR